VLRRQQDMLQIRAPMAGMVMNTPKVTDIGKLWEMGQDQPLLSIGDPNDLRVAMPVGPADRGLLDRDERDLAASHTHCTLGWLGVRVTDKGISPINDEDGLGVVIRVQGRGTDNWRGRLEPLPQSDTKNIPQALMNKSGGPVPMKPRFLSMLDQPQSQQY